MSASVKFSQLNRKLDVFLFSLIFCSSLEFLHIGGDDNKFVVGFGSKEIKKKKN
jgi:hypothetical protein